jgi:hypothetical protein
MKITAAADAVWLEDLGMRLETSVARGLRFRSGKGTLTT